jgi:hypothetical protein
MKDTKDDGAAQDKLSAVSHQLSGKSGFGLGQIGEIHPAGSVGVAVLLTAGGWQLTAALPHFA